MLRTRGWIVFISLGLLFVSALSPAQAVRRARKPQQTQPVLPAMPSGPLTQLPMDQIPASPPQVSYQGGMLTIVAQNSTLADILREVRKLTGASIEVPANATERVVTRLGPGPARDVLASLLNGSAFNYVMLGSASDPTTLSAVMLTTKSGGSAPANTSVAMAAPPDQGFVPAQGVPQVVAAPGTPGQADADDESDDSDDSADDDKDDNNANNANNGNPTQPVANPMQEINPNNQGLGELSPDKLQQLRERMKPPQPLPQFPPPPNNQQ